MGSGPTGFGPLRAAATDPIWDGATDFGRSGFGPRGFGRRGFGLSDFAPRAFGRAITGLAPIETRAEGKVLAATPASFGVREAFVAAQDGPRGLCALVSSQFASSGCALIVCGATMARLECDREGLGPGLEPGGRRGGFGLPR